MKIITKAVSHVKKHWFAYGVGTLFGMSVLQTQNIVNFAPALEAVSLSVDKMLEYKDIILGWGAGTLTVMKAGKVMLGPAVADYNLTKTKTKEVEILMTSKLVDSNKALALEHKIKNELELKRINEQRRQNDILENIKSDQKSLPDVLVNIKDVLKNTSLEVLNDTGEGIIESAENFVTSTLSSTGDIIKDKVETFVEAKTNLDVEL